MSEAAGSGSPRGQVHAALIRALTAHDAELLQAAVEQARRTPGSTTPEGLASAERALKVLAGSSRPGEAAARRRFSARQLQAAIESGSEAELQTAILEAVEAGVEEGLGDAERALAAVRENRGRTLDALVVAMEACVESTEQSVAHRGPVGCARDVLDKLRFVLDEARHVAGPQDELVVTAGRLLDFETQRETELRNLDQQLRGHLARMEGIAEQVERRFPPRDGTESATSSGVHIRAMDAYNTTIQAAQSQPRPQRQGQPLQAWPAEFARPAGRDGSDEEGAQWQTPGQPSTLHSVSPHDVAGMQQQPRGQPSIMRSVSPRDIAGAAEDAGLFATRPSLASLASKKPVGLPGGRNDGPASGSGAPHF